MTNINLLAFLKSGEKQFMLNFLNKGELYLNTLNYYKVHENKEIGDDWEDITNIKIGKVSLIDEKDDTKVPISDKNIPIRFNTSPSHKNAFCMYSICPQHFLVESNYKILDIPKNVTKGFGDTTILIADPVEFLKRIETKLNELGYKYTFGFVTYYNEESYEGNLNAFWKRRRYSTQREFRILVENKVDSFLKFEIGSIQDIAKAINNKMVKYSMENGDDYIFRIDT